MNNSSNISRLFIVLFLIGANLLSQLYFKYSIYSIPLSEINFLYLGNIFNFLLTILILIGAVILYLFNRGYEKREFSFIVTILLFAIISYVLGYVLAKADYEPLNSYLFGLPSRRVYLAIIFLVNLYLQYYLLAFIWGTIVGRQSSSSLKAFSGAVLALSLTLGFSYYFVSSKDYRINDFRSIKHYDTAVVLGAAVWSNNKPSTIFEGRIKKVAQLYKEAKVRSIQLTGGNAPGEISEAQAAKNYLASIGYKGKYILIEEKTSTTSQQIEFVQNKFDCS